MSMTNIQITYSEPLYLGEITTPLGPMTAACDQEALVSLTFSACPPRSALSAPDAHPILKQISSELALYFDGSLRVFQTPLRLYGTPFQKTVWAQLISIPFGKTVSYKALAESIHRPTAYRAVAGANARNPIAILVPCHRVINHSGALGGYAGGIDKKMWLLEHERRMEAR